MNNTHIVIENMVFQKIMHWVNKSNYEVSGLGKITYADGRITVVDAMLLPQKSGSAHTDIEGVDVAKAMYLLKDTPGDLRWWWHSHVNMDVFWSGTDRDTIDKISAGGWFTATVFNKKREMRSALSMRTPLPLGLIDNIDTHVLQFLDPELTNKWDADYDKNVSTFMRNYSEKTYLPKEVSRFQEGSGRTKENSPSEDRDQTAFPGMTDGDKANTGGNESGGIEETEDAIDRWMLEARQRQSVGKSGPPIINGKTGGW